MKQITFAELQLIDPLLAALKSENYSIPTPIQVQAIPEMLAGRDLLGCARTGTGKTAAFALPILQRLQQAAERPARGSASALILTPTRELASQISESIRVYGRNLKLKSAVIFGGVGHVPQIRALAPGVDVLVATPGRLLDLLGQRHINLSSVKYLVLDEADRMLDMGFIHDVKRILGQMPKQRQTALFSATMPAEVMGLAESVLSQPVKVSVNPVSSTVDQIDDRVLFVERENKQSLLIEVLRDKSVRKAVIFTKTKHRANRLSRHLNSNRITAEAIHGNKSQNARQRALADFVAGNIRVLVATDIISRGIDVEGISHVINYELPSEPESYVHRIGRTARAGASGVALSLCDRDESEVLADIERVIKRSIPVLDDHSHHSEEIARRHSARREARNAKGSNARRASGAGTARKDAARPRRRRRRPAQHAAAGARMRA